MNVINGEIRLLNESYCQVLQEYYIEKSIGYALALLLLSYTMKAIVQQIEKLMVYGKLRHTAVRSWE